MNHKGQVLVLFMLLLPLIFMALALIIDTGLLYMEKRHVDFVVKDVVEYGMENINSVTEKKLYDLIDRNLDLVNKKEIINNNGMLNITVSVEKKSIFSKIFGYEKYQIESTYKGMIEQNKIKIVRG